MRAIVVFITLFFLTVPAHAEKRVALVIGNSSYELIAPLANPKNDAELMAATLEDVGFDVVTAIDVDVRGMGRAVRRFGKRLRRAGKDAVGLLYYAGHGVQYRGANYLIPLGAEIESSSDLDIEAMSAARILSQMDDAGNRMFVCSDTDYCASRRKAGHVGAQAAAASAALKETAACRRF